MFNTAAFKKLGQQVIDLENQAVASLSSRVDQAFCDAGELILNCSGRVVVVGMGKSGHIGGKIAATLASTGTPAFFVHPGEASHGDLGMITANDTVLAISNSGETAEILTILPLIKRMEVKLIAFTGNSNSTLAKQADVVIDVGVDKEACPLNLAPTSSTTVTLVMGDALAVALLESRGFTEEDFARSHPGGALGKRLLLFVKDIMHSGDAVPSVLESAKLTEALLEMTGKGLGMTAVVDNEQKLAGIFTDGDLRRVLNQRQDITNIDIRDVMSRNPVTCHTDMLAAEAVAIMESKKINGLVALDDENRVVGALNMLDLLAAGVV
ncbi:MAG: KpsF/GutQ family sugar-phosphate isomerase [Acidiferrobacterales bacterium]